MAKAKSGAKAKSVKVKWLDDKANPMIQSYTERLSTFLDAMADGVVDPKELDEQEERLVALMKKVEPQLTPELHQEVTSLLCELTAFNIMRTTHELSAARPKIKFRG